MLSSQKQTRQTTLDSMMEQRGEEVAEDEFPGLADVIEVQTNRYHHSLAYKPQQEPSCSF